jgi:hypothetical protein
LQFSATSGRLTLQRPHAGSQWIAFWVSCELMVSVSFDGVICIFSQWLSVDKILQSQMLQSDFS